MSSSELKMTEVKRDTWAIAELLTDHRSVFVIWMIHEGFCSNHNQFMGHFESDVPLLRLINDLQSSGFIQRSKDELSLTDKGRWVISYVKDNSFAEETGKGLKDSWSLRRAQNNDLLSCRDCVDLLLDYLDGNLDAETQSLLDEHFSACPPCVNFLETFSSSRTVSQALGHQEHGKETVSSELKSRLISLMKETQTN